MPGYADTVSDFHLGSIVGRDGCLNLKIVMRGGALHVVLPTQPAESWWVPGMVLPHEFMLLDEFLTRLRSTTDQLHELPAA